MATKTKKPEQAPPGPDGKTRRECVSCEEPIRTKRMRSCRTCWRKEIVDLWGEGAARRYDEIDFYAMTDA